MILQNQEAEKPHLDATEKTYPRHVRKYRIQPGDIISIQISSLVNVPVNFLSTEQNEVRNNGAQQHPFLRGYTVNDSGMVDVPVIGYTMAEGKTLNEFQIMLNDSAQRYFTNPQVRVFLLNFNVTVLGEVNRPGAYVAYMQDPDLLDAIGLAGGMSDFADRAKVKIVRTHAETVEVLYIDITDQALITQGRFFIQPNDMIYIQPLARKKFTSNNFPWVVPSLSLIIATLSLVIRN
ncbi:MAG: polysaccharide biosynthesis/export family protein [Bacteroidota bacterium]